MLGIVLGLGSVGGSGAEPPHREGDAVEATLLLPKCFPNNNRCPCSLKRISSRDFKVEAEAQGGHAGRTDSLCLSHPSPCVLI